MPDNNEIRKAAEEQTDPRIDLAVERTELALERTHLAWVRTVFTLITAGLAIDKGMQALHESRVLKGEAWTNNSHLVGIVLVILGTVLLVMVTASYIVRSRQLARMKNATPSWIQPGVILSLVLFILGALLSFFLIHSD